jgi:hypothetical protein
MLCFPPRADATSLMAGSAPARASALDAAVSTLEVPGLGEPNGLFVMADGTRLVAAHNSTLNRLQLLTPAGLLARLAGDEDDDDDDEDDEDDHDGSMWTGITVDAAGQIVVADRNHALLRVSQACKVSTLAGNGEEGFEDGQ